MKMNCSTCEYQEQCETPFDGSKCIKARLDKVLAKFEKIFKGRFLQRNLFGLIIYYNVETKEFYIEDCEKVISLNTVESLIKDMEEK